MSISLDKEASMLVSAIMDAEGCTNVSAFIQKVIREYASSQGYELVPATVIKTKPQ